MNLNKIISIVNFENFKRYGDSNIVEEYLLEPYHVMRIKISLQNLSKGLLNSFPNTPLSEISVIDIGCGSGAVSKKICKLGYKVVAADFSESPIVLNKKENIEKVIFDANDVFPFRDNSFHSIFSGELIEHLFDTSHFLNECKRILKPKGILVLTTPNLAGLEDRIKFLFGITPRHVNPLHPYLKLHIRQFTKSSLVKTLSSFEFENVIVKSNYLKIYLSDNHKIQIRLLAKLFPSLGGSLISVSNKK